MRTLLAILTAAVSLTLMAAGPQPPARLSQTGLYAAPGVLASGLLAYQPQYPLWTDGAAKSRWLRLPPGTAIDGRHEDAWTFPVGTKAWKEFRFHGRKVETRLLWKVAPSRWIFASYAWNATQTDATLVPEAGQPRAAEIAPGAFHSLPSQEDCRACHGEERVELLGFNALQLSPDRDPGAIHGEPLQPGKVTLRELVARGLLRGARPDLLSRPPRIPAEDPATRTALGYLAGNCAACHRADRPLPGLDLDFRHLAAATRASEEPGLHTTLGRTGSYQIPGGGPSLRLKPGDPDGSSLIYRMGSRRPTSQMPPLGSALVDQEALQHLRSWIARLPSTP